MAVQTTPRHDAIRGYVTRYPWVTGAPMTRAEALMLRRYVAAHPWTPGNTGNGIVTPLGNVVTWATYDAAGEPDLEGAPWHELVIRALYPQLLGDYGDVRGAFKIDIDGSTDDRGELAARDHDRIGAALRRAAEAPALTDLCPRETA